MPRTTNPLIRWLLVVAGGVDMWTVGSADDVYMKVAAGIIAAIMFMAAGLLWERSVPTLADSVAQHMFGQPTAMEGLMFAAGELVKAASAPVEKSDG